MSAILEFIHHHANSIPFVVMTAGQVNVKLSTQRILEALVIGAVLFGGGYLAIIPVLQEQMIGVERRVATESETIRREIIEVKGAISDHLQLSGHPMAVRTEAQMIYLEKRINAIEAQIRK